MEVGGGRVPEVENDEIEVGVAHEEIGGLHGAAGAGAAHPQQMREQIAVERGRVERVRAVDQRDPPAFAPRDGEQLRE